MKKCIRVISLFLILTQGIGNRAYAQWISVLNGTFPARALPAGYEADGSRLHIARAIMADGHYHIGKVRVNSKEAFIPYGGQEVLVEKFQVYIGMGSWEAVSERHFPRNGVSAGNDGGQIVLLPARAFINGGIHVGKVRLNGREACIPYGGKELLVSDFEVLTKCN